MVVVQGDTKRKYYVRRLATKQEELAALEEDLDSTRSGRDRLRIEREIEPLLEEIDELEGKLQQGDSRSSSANVRDRNLELMLRKIDFDDAKQFAELARGDLVAKGGSLLLFMQRSKKQKGDYCLEEMMEIIMRDQIVNGQIMGAYSSKEVSLDSSLSDASSREFLIRLAETLGVEVVGDEAGVLEAVRQKIILSMGPGSTVFLAVRGVDAVLDVEDFLVWLVDEFWTPLVESIQAFAQKKRCKLIMALVSDSKLLANCSADCFVTPPVLDPQKLTNIELPDWCLQDIDSWMMKFASDFPGLQRASPREIRRLANKIFRESEGTPESVCLSLREDLYGDC